MPAEKAARVAERRRQRNRSIRSGTRTLVRKAIALMEQGSLGEAEAAVQAALSALDKAAQKGAIHENAADRSKSRLVRRLNQARARAA